MAKMKTSFFFAVIALLFSFLSGCLKDIPPIWISKLPLAPPPPGAEEIFRLSDGEKISFRQLLDDLRESRVIFVGESHDQMEHHQIQRRMISDLSGQGKNMVIAMEMFQKSQQSILDRWSQGLLTEEEFLQQVQWETTWGMNYQLYKGILEEARDRRLKVLGLNVPRELIRKIAQRGIENLSEEERNGLPIMDLTDRQHRAYLEEVYKRHEAGLAKDFEKFYQAQVLWDEGMAEHLSGFLSSAEGQEKTVIVLTGTGHIIHHFGIPKRLYRRSPLSYKTIVLKEWRKGIGEDLDLTQQSFPLADYLWITHPSAPQQERPKIGIVLREEGEPAGVWIERVLPKSPAENAGLVSGDRILFVDGKEIKRLRDLHDAVTQKRVGNKVLFTIQRNGSKKEIDIILRP